MDVERAALLCCSADLADLVGIAWRTSADVMPRAERRAWRHAIERAATLHLAPRSGRRGVPWRPRWRWYRPDGHEVCGGAL